VWANCGWVLAANIVASPTYPPGPICPACTTTTTSRTPSRTRSVRLWHLPAWLVRHARKRVLKISRTWPWTDAFLACA